jgi:hypothetical protein
MAYLLDSNAFIEPKRRHYPFDFCPAYWDWLDQACAKGVVCSISQVGAELISAGDELSDWVKDRADMFLEPTLKSVKAYGAVSVWATGAGYEPGAITTFLDVADSYLVATAMAGNHVVVTAEKPENTKRRVKIPNACVQFGVAFVNVFEMLRREKARFTLGRRS